MISTTVLNTEASRGHGIIYGFSYKGNLVYVGSTKNTIADRAGLYGKKYIYKDATSKFGEFILLHGWENLEVEILATPILSQLTKVEDEFIEKYDLIKNGCNKYRACDDDEDEAMYTKKVNGNKINIHHIDNLRGDVRIGLIHDQTLKLNLQDKEVFKPFYVSPCRGNSLEKNNLSYYDKDDNHTTVQKTLRQYWLKDLAKEYNISRDLKLAEDIYDYRREVILVNRVGRSYKKMPLTQFLKEIAQGKKPLYKIKAEEK